MAKTVGRRWGKIWDLYFNLSVLSSSAHSSYLFFSPIYTNHLVDGPQFHYYKYQYKFKSLFPNSNLTHLILTWQFAPLESRLEFLYRTKWWTFLINCPSYFTVFHLFTLHHLSQYSSDIGVILEISSYMFMYKHTASTSFLFYSPNVSLIWLSLTSSTYQPMW